jgi:hypothetical protein
VRYALWTASFPNKNTREDDEADDLYTRRFFLVDAVRNPFCIPFCMM